MENFRENFMCLVFCGVPLLFGISFIINVVILIIKGDRKYVFRALTDLAFGILSVSPRLHYYKIWVLYGTFQWTSVPLAGDLIMVIITKVYFMVNEKKLLNTPKS